MDNENNAKNLWQRVKTIIKSQKVTQEGLAEKASVSFSNLKQQIFHERSPMVHEAVRIAKALDTTVEYLVTGENKGNAEITNVYNKIPDNLKDMALDVLKVFAKTTSTKD